MSRTAICTECRRPFDFEPPPNAPACTSQFKPDLCQACSRAQRAAEQAAEIETDLRARNIPQRYVDASFANFAAMTLTQRQALEAARDHPLEGLFLMGRAGCGKTHLAAAAIKVGPPGSLFVTSTELLDDIRASFDRGGQGLFERARSAPLLALDDLGSEATTDWARGRLYALLNERWNHCSPLIITTNCSPKRIAERIGDGAASRIAGVCACRIEVQGDDMRRKPCAGAIECGAAAQAHRAAAEETHGS